MRLRSEDYLVVVVDRFMIVIVMMMVVMRWGKRGMVVVGLMSFLVTVATTQEKIPEQTQEL